MRFFQFASVSSLVFRSLIMLSGAAALSACTTMDDPKLTAKDLAVGTVQTVQTVQTEQAVQTVDGAATNADVVATVTEATAIPVASNTGNETQVLALAAIDEADPVLPAAVPLPMFRQTATEALIATATPSLPVDMTIEPGEVKFNGVTKSGTASHLVEERAKASENVKPNLHNLIGQYAAAYQVPERLVHRVVQRESRYNPAARNGRHLGLMQISHATARGMGYEGTPQGLLNANTNLRYAVKYLAGAYKVADGNETQAVKFYSRGYYYDAKRKGLLEETGLLKGPNSINTVFLEPKPAIVVAEADPILTQAVAVAPAGKASRIQHKARDISQR